MKRIVIIYDQENINLTSIKSVLKKTRKKYPVADYKIVVYSGSDKSKWTDLENAYQIVHKCLTYAKGKKNALDQVLIQAGELTLTSKKNRADIMAIVSNDKHFCPLIKKAQAAGIQVLTYGNENQSKSLRAFNLNVNEESQKEKEDILDTIANSRCKSMSSNSITIKIELSEDSKEILQKLFKLMV